MNGMASEFTKSAQETEGATLTEPTLPGPAAPQEIGYWLVGAYWEGQVPPDQTERFLDEGIWVNGYVDRYLDEVIDAGGR
jgi:hypothetical protein